MIRLVNSLNKALLVEKFQTYYNYSLNISKFKFKFMGAENTKMVSERLQTLEGRLKNLTNDVQSLQDTVKELPKNYLLKSELDPKISKVEEDAATSSEKLSQLMEITRDQQQVIIELGNQYAQLCDGYQTQQETLESITTRCEERISKYDEELQGAKVKLGSIETEVMQTSELARAIGIRKTDNMIKKEHTSSLSGTKKPVSLAKKSIEDKVKPKDKSQTRSQKKAEKETINDSAKGKTKENEVLGGQENQPNFLDIIMNERKEVNPAIKETLTEVDINTL